MKETKTNNMPTLEELKAELKTAQKAYELIKEKCAKLEKEEAEARKAKLAAEKESRYKEVVAAYENFEELRGEYVKDYGSFTFKTSSSMSLPHWFNMFEL